MAAPRRGKSILGIALAASRLAALCLASLCLASLCLASFAHPALAAQPTAEQRTQARAAEAALKKAGNLYRSKKFALAGEAVKDAQQNLDRLPAGESRELAALTAPLVRQLEKLRDLLMAEGIQLTPPKSAPPKSGPPKSGPNEKNNPSVSFTKQVAPILVARCGACHIQRARGEFSMATYVALGRGSKNGAAIMPGDAKGSRMVELIESGDMPRGGGKMSAEELSLLSAWIGAGAKFDGPDSAAPLASFSRQPKIQDDSASKLTVVAATGREAVQFARDVGPLLLAACTECHAGRNPRANFSMNTFATLLRGGDNGVVIAPLKPAESLLVKKLRGAAGARMPLNRSALPEEAIATIEKWISLGARFDGPDPDSSLEETVNMSIAERSSHEELSRWRMDLAAKDWRLILPDAKANRQQTPDVLVYGNAGTELLADVARTADEQVSKLRKLFKVPTERPLIKGRLTLYVFEKRFDYGEVGTMLEHREIPAASRGHWHYSPLDTYACVLLSSDGKAPPGLVSQQIAGAYMASLGKIPRWFAEGTARAVAAKLDPKDPRVKAWDDQVSRVLQTHEKPDGFLTGSLAPEDSDVLSYSFVKYLMTPPTRHAGLVATLQQGTAFDPAFAKAYGASPSQMIANWLPRAGKRGR